MQVRIEKVGVQLVRPDSSQPTFMDYYAGIYKLTDMSSKMSRMKVDEDDIPDGVYEMPDSLFDFNNPMELEGEI